MPGCRQELATTYVNLGEVQVRQGRLDDAIGSFRQACSIFEEENGRDVHYPYAYAGLGQAYHLAGNDEEAEVCYEKALTLIERDFGRTPFYDEVAAGLAEVKGR